MLANYDVSNGEMLIWLIPITIAYFLNKQRKKDLQEGRIKGVPRSNGIFDFMFRDYNKD